MNLLTILAVTSENKDLTQSFIEALPFILFISLMYFYFRGQAKRNKGYLERAQIHMDALEKKTDRMIELLEEINTKNKPN